MEIDRPKHDAADDLTLSGSVFVIFDEAGEAKVSDLANELSRHQNVGSSQVSMDIVLLLYVSHSLCDLQGAVKC